MVLKKGLSLRGKHVRQNCIFQVRDTAETTGKFKQKIVILKTVNYQMLKNINSFYIGPGIEGDKSECGVVFSDSSI